MYLIHFCPVILDQGRACQIHIFFLPFFFRAMGHLRYCPQFYIAAAGTAGAGEELFTLLTDRKPALILLLRYPVRMLDRIAVFFDHIQLCLL